MGPKFQQVSRWDSEVRRAAASEEWHSDTTLCRITIRSGKDLKTQTTGFAARIDAAICHGLQRQSIGGFSGDVITNFQSPSGIHPSGPIASTRVMGHGLFSALIAASISMIRFMDANDYEVSYATSAAETYSSSCP